VQSQRLRSSFSRSGISVKSWGDRSSCSLTVCQPQWLHATRTERINSITGSAPRAVICQLPKQSYLALNSQPISASTISRIRRYFGGDKSDARSVDSLYPAAARCLLLRRGARCARHRDLPPGPRPGHPVARRATVGGAGGLLQPAARGGHAHRGGGQLARGAGADRRDGCGAEGAGQFHLCGARLLPRRDSQAPMIGKHAEKHS
jgi:hypothetical protein